MRTTGYAGVTFHQPVAFWLGTAAITAGVALHLPDYVMSSEMGFRMAGMEMGWMMHTGMALIVGGMLLAAYGLLPFGRFSGNEIIRPMGEMDTRSMDAATLSPAHWGLLFVLGAALIVDVMKPATLGFVIPGMKEEYGLTTAQIAVLPLIALAGTTIGSLCWGILADRIGRRAAILLASLMFIGTSICGFMPSYGWNIFMCFVMGLSAGGMLPIVYALMAESIPARRRGWLVVLHAGMGTVGGYLAASGLAALVVPDFGWRILWLQGLPTGLIVLVLNRWIPESPRFLLERGRNEEAEAVMKRYGVTLGTRPAAANAAGGVAPHPPAEAASASALSVAKHGQFRALFRPPLVKHTMTVGVYGLGWGLVNWGFLTFIPVILQDRGMQVGLASRMLFFSALIAIPGTVLVAWLYGMWSSKRSMILFAMLTVVALVGFAIVDPGANGSGTVWLSGLTVLLLVGSGGVISMLSPYTAEVFPTALRGTGSGVAAGSSKLGGIFGPPIFAGVLALAPGFTALAIVVSVPMVISAVVLAFNAVETKDRGLEELVGAQEPAA